MPRLHYLMVMWDGGGTLPPELAIAHQLLKAGHQVSVLGEDSMRQEVISAACRFIPYQHAPNRPDRRPESDPYPDWGGQSPFQVLRTLLCKYAAGYARDVVEACQAHSIDRVIVDGFLLGGMIGAEAAGKPLSVVWPAIDIVPHPGRPPDGLGLSPGHTPWSRGRNHLLNFMFKKILQGGKKELNAVRVSYGLPPLYHPFDQYRNAKKVLLLTSRHFDYPTQLPANTYYAGPQLADPSWAIENKVNVASPFVLVSLGSTFQNQKALYQKLVDALSQLSIPSIITLGNVFEPGDFIAYPNVTILQSAAHTVLLPQCGLIINHGGHGIVMKSILAGLPQLVIPLGRDQMGNAARIKYHGIGLNASRKAAIPELLQKIKTLLSDDSYGRKTGNLAQKIKEEIAEGLLKYFFKRQSDFHFGP